MLSDKDLFEPFWWVLVEPQMKRGSFFEAVTLLDMLADARDDTFQNILLGFVFKPFTKLLFSYFQHFSQHFSSFTFSCEEHRF